MELTGRRDNAGKPRVDLVSPSLILAVAEVSAYGAEKYAARNWEQGMPYGKVYASLIQGDPVQRYAGVTRHQGPRRPGAAQGDLKHAAIRQWCDRPAFAAPSIPRPATTFLRPAEATALVQSAAPHLRPLLVFLIGTGCRLSEALELEWVRVDLRGARAVVEQKQGDERHVDLPPVVLAAMSTLPERDGAVFRPDRQRTRRPDEWQGYRTDTTSGGGQIKKAWATACRIAELPGHWNEWTSTRAKKALRQWVPDVTPHDLRHTWATWDYCLHRDLIGLKDRGAGERSRWWRDTPRRCLTPIGRRSRRGYRAALRW